MIQRIQSIYLLLALAFGVSMFFTQQISFTTESMNYILNFKGILQETQGAWEVISSTVALTILLILTPLVSLVTILLYKKRLVQIRLCAANIGLLLGTTGLIYYFGREAAKQLPDTVLSYNITAVFPLIAAVLTYLALRAIGKDEALIRSVDRIR